MHKRLITTRKAVLACSIVATGASGLAAIQEAPLERERPPRACEPLTPPPPSAIDTHALRIVQRVGERIERADSFTARIDYTFEIRGPHAEEEIKQRAVHDLAFQNLNLMRVEHIEGRLGETIVSDGRSIFIYLPQRNRYVEQDAPSDLRGLMEHPGAMVGAPGGLGGPLSFVGMILVPELFDGLAQLLRSAAYVGTKEIDGERVHQVMLAVAFPLEPESREPGGLREPESAPSSVPGVPANPANPGANKPAVLDAGAQASPDQEVLLPPTPGHEIRPQPAAPELVLDLWIQEREENMVLRRMGIDLSRIIGGHDAAPPELADYSIDVMIAMNEWEFNVEIPKEKFTFTPPEGARRVETLREMVVDAGPGPAHPLIGQPAPTFELQRLIGTGIDLAEHIGRDTVILDFWATWCTPCIRAIPHLMTVARDFRSENVVFYFINLREDFDRVQNFVEDRGWEGRLMIPMDIEGRVAEKYGVTAIPQTVIIDKQGIVQQVHIGFTPGMEDRMRSEIQTLLDGGSLIKGDDHDVDERKEGDDEKQRGEE